MESQQAKSAVSAVGKAGETTQQDGDDASPRGTAGIEEVGTASATERSDEGVSSVTERSDDVDSDDARDIIGMGNPTAPIERQDTRPTLEGMSAEDVRQGQRKGLEKEGKVVEKTKPRWKTAHHIVREKLHSKAHRRRQCAREASNNTNGAQHKLKK